MDIELVNLQEVLANVNGFSWTVVIMIYGK